MADIDMNTLHAAGRARIVEDLANIRDAMKQAEGQGFAKEIERLKAAEAALQRRLEQMAANQWGEGRAGENERARPDL
ncbi:MULTISPECIES: hypothetical protein [unclassified Xanthobacter]|uniref:hypothetical protein n=1 Tax=unclassified Xanthobacter TaxID=2623496 RepID=UPI001F46ECBE|nr:MULTISPECIES: hypothetical protein [unclassified Xanthobacter]